MRAAGGGLRHRMTRWSDRHDSSAIQMDQAGSRVAHRTSPRRSIAGENPAQRHDFDNRHFDQHVNIYEHFNVYKHVHHFYNRGRLFGSY